MRQLWWHVSPRGASERNLRIWVWETICYPTKSHCSLLSRWMKTKHCLILLVITNQFKMTVKHHFSLQLAHWIRSLWCYISIIALYGNSCPRKLLHVSKIKGDNIHAFIRANCDQSKLGDSLSSFCPTYFKSLKCHFCLKYKITSH